MSYIFKQKLKLSDLVALGNPGYKILILEPEDYVFGIYHRHFNAHNFIIQRSESFQTLLGDLFLHRPHLLILSADSIFTPQNFFNQLNFVRNSFPQLPFVTIGYNLPPEQLKSLMSIGISSHIDRSLCRPQDVVEIVKTILHY